jgi:hypothetical protein
MVRSMEATPPAPPPDTPATPPPPPPPPPEPEGGAGVGDGAYPVQAHAPRQDEYNRFLPLVKWLLAIPHYIVLTLVAIVGLFVIIIAFFAVLFTGRYPEGLHNFMVGLLRWSFRVHAYVFLLTDRYPPFSLQHDPDYPATLQIEYPADGVNRWRPLVQWLLIIPYAIVASILYYVAAIVAFIGIFVILFTKHLPEGMFKLILNPFRWQVRANAYMYWIVKRYPPFEWE